ncbi:Sec63 [Tulasnella sp. 427]|nr:Sec63 [Tulasnella sp. 427]
MLDFRLFDLLQRHACGKPVLIFCPTRKGVAATAEQLAKEYKKCVEEKRKAPWTHPERAEGRFQDAQLNVLLASGLGVHHAGLSMDDRKMTEEFYLTGQIRALVATSTLAVGVNLPAHTVVIKGTQMWSGAAWTEYCDLDVMQMLGRAGRPQFGKINQAPIHSSQSRSLRRLSIPDKEGLAIIMCSSDKEQHYRALTSGTTTIESSLHMNLTEHLNSEVGLGTITSLETAKSWLHNSFLFQRLKRNPSHYALGKDASQTWEQRLNDLVAESVQSLCELDLVTTTRDDVGHIRMLAATDFGEIMSRYYIRYPTMRLILQLPEKVTMRELLEMITQADEFTDVRLRGSDRQVYNALKDNSDIRMTVKKIEKPCDKIFVLLQAVLGGVSLNVKEYKTAESQPALEALGVLRHAVRIARAMVDIAGVKRNAFQLKFGLELLRSFSAKAWDDRPIVLRQIPQIGEKSLKVLASVGIRGLGELRTQDSHRLEVLLNRKPPFGHDILEEVSALPKYRLKINEAALTHSGGTEPVVASLAIEVGLDGPLTTPRGKKAPILGFASVLTVTSDMEFIDYRRIPVRNLTEPKSFTVVARLEKPSQAIEVMVSSESYAGLSVLQHYKPVLSPKSYPTMKTRPKTELAELEGLQGVDPSIWTITEEEIFRRVEGTQDDIVAPVPTQSSVPEATQLPNGRFACREGLAKAPKSLKGPAEPKATQPPPQNFAATSGLSTNKPNVGPTPTKKSKSQSSIADKTMEKLNKLQESSNVGLKMPSGGRLSLSNENKGNSTRPPWLAEAEFSPKYASLYSPKRDEEDEDLPDIAGKALRTTKRGKDEAPSTDYSDDAFNELLANADWEALSRPPKRTTNSIRKRSPDEEEDVLLVEEDDMPPAKKLRTHKGSIPVASSSRTPFGDRNGSTLLSANKTSATSSKPGTENKRPLFLPASSPSPPSTYHHAPAPLQQNDVETVDVDPLPLDARPNKSHTLGLGDFGFDEELFEMEEDPLAGEVDDNVRGGPLAPGTSMVSADTHGTGGTFRGLGQVASSSSAALSSSAHAFGSGALGRPGLALANRPSLSLGAANSGSSSTSRVKDPLQSEAEVRSEPAAPAHGADDGGARQDSDVTRSGVDAPVARGCLYDAVGAFLDWMENSGDVEFVD